MLYLSTMNAKKGFIAEMLFCYEWYFELSRKQNKCCEWDEEMNSILAELLKILSNLFQYKILNRYLQRNSNAEWIFKKYSYTLNAFWKTI